MSNNTLFKHISLFLLGTIFFLLITQVLTIQGLENSPFLANQFKIDPIGTKQWLQHSPIAFLLKIDFFFLLYESDIVIKTIYLAIFCLFIVNLHITFTSIKNKYEIIESISLIVPMLGMLGTFYSMMLFMIDISEIDSVLEAWKANFGSAVLTTILAVAIYIFNIIVNLKGESCESY